MSQPTADMAAAPQEPSSTPTTVIAAGQILWQPKDPKQLDSLIEYGLFTEPERLSLTGQIINKLGQFKFHMLEDGLRLAHEPNKLLQFIHRLDPVDQADLALCERQIAVIRALQPLEKLINQSATAQQLDQAIEAAETKIKELEQQTPPTVLRDHLADADSYYQKQTKYLRNKLASLREDVLDPSTNKVKEFALQEWIRDRIARVNNDFNGSTEILNSEKIRLKNLGGIRAGKLSTIANDLDKLNTDYAFSQHGKITAEHQGSFSEAGVTVFDTQDFPGVNTANLSKVIAGIESEDIKAAMHARRDMKAKLLAEEAKPPLRTRIAKFFRGIGHASAQAIVNFPRSMADAIRTGFREYAAIQAPSPANADVLAEKVLQELNQKIPSPPPAEPLTPDAVTAPASPLSESEQKALQIITEMLQKAAQGETITEQDLQKLRHARTELPATPKTSTPPVFAKPGSRLYNVEEGDILTSTAGFVDNFIGFFEHDLYRQKPGAALVFSTLYAVSGGLILAPQVTTTVLTHLGVSAKSVTQFIAFLNQLSHVIGGGIGGLNQAMTAGFMMGKLGLVPVDILSNGGTSMMLKPIIDSLQEARLAGEFATPASTIKYLTQELFKLGIGTAALLGIGYGLAQAVPALEEELGSLWEFGALVISGKVVGLGYEMVSAAHTMPIDLLKPDVSKADQKLYQLAVVVQSGMQKDPHFMDKYLGENKKEFCQAIVALSERYNLENKIDLSLFGKPPLSLLSKLIIGIAKPVLLVGGALLSPIVGLIRGLQTASKQGWSGKVFMDTAGGIMRRAWGRLGGWMGNIVKTLGNGLGRAIKMFPRWVVNLGTRLTTGIISLIGNTTAKVVGLMSKEDGATVRRATSRAITEVVRAKTAIFHAVDNVARFIKRNVIRRFTALYHRGMSSNKPISESAQDLFGHHQTRASHTHATRKLLGDGDLSSVTVRPVEEPQTPVVGPSLTKEQQPQPPSSDIESTHQPKPLTDPGPSKGLRG